MASAVEVIWADPMVPTAVTTAAVLSLGSTVTVTIVSSEEAQLVGPSTCAAFPILSTQVTFACIGGWSIGQVVAIGDTPVMVIAPKYHVSRPSIVGGSGGGGR